MNRTTTAFALGALLGAAILWLAWQRSGGGDDSGPGRGHSSSTGSGTAATSRRQVSDLPSKTDRTPMASTVPRITEDDVERWLDIPQDEWLAEFDEKAPDIPRRLRNHVWALIAEFQELRQRYLVPWHRAVSMSFL